MNLRSKETKIQTEITSRSSNDSGSSSTTTSTVKYDLMLNRREFRQQLMPNREHAYFITINATFFAHSPHSLIFVFGFRLHGTTKSDTKRPAGENYSRNVCTMYIVSFSPTTTPARATRSLSKFYQLVVIAKCYRHYHRHSHFYTSTFANRVCALDSRHTKYTCNLHSMRSTHDNGHDAPCMLMLKQSSSPTECEIRNAYN